MWHIPSCLSSQASEDSTSESNSPPPDRTYWAMSKGTQQPLPPSWRGWKSRPWIQHLYGLETYRTWIGAARACFQTSLQPDSLARTLATLEEGLGLREPEAGSGGKFTGQFASYDQDTSSWKTCQQSLLEGSTLYSGRWPKSGTIRSGAACERPMLVLRIDESGGSAWPTPAFTDYKGQSADPSKRNRTLDVAESWPTPTSKDQDSSGAAGYSTASGRHSGTKLTDASRAWPTPDARVMNDGETPETFDARRRRLKAKGINGNGAGLRLTVESKRFLQVHLATRNGEPSSPSTRTSRPRLNPAFAAWLMGFPWWWTRPEPTSFGARGTALWRSRLRLLFEILSAE